MTRIKDAAIMVENGTVYALPRPHRHHDIICQLQSLGESLAGAIQGFVTEENVFVTRAEAMRIAKKAEQIRSRTRFEELYTEDLF